MTIETYPELTKNLEYFIANQDELCSKYNGKHLLINKQQVDSVYNNAYDAYTEGIKKFVPGEFSLQYCIPGKEAYTIKQRPSYTISGGQLL